MKTTSIGPFSAAMLVSVLVAFRVGDDMIDTGALEFLARDGGAFGVESESGEAAAGFR